MKEFIFKKQQFQEDAVNAVCDVFLGEQGGMFKYLSGKKTGALDKFVGTTTNLYGFQHNQLNLSNEQLLKNLQKVQEKFVRNKGVELTKEINKEDINLTIEMETGTGKTYTYINTIYELNKRYNWNKFIVVVPSIAIREGVSKSFEDMEKHFKAEYGKEINHFIFNSSKIEEVNNFERDDGINVMIINNQAFSSKTTHNIFQKNETGIAPIEKIKRTNPIIIIDEPQSVEGTTKKNKSRENLKSEFNSLFTLRYSATHRESYNLIYILDPVDAFNQKLVKKIEVMGVEVKGTTATNTYLYLDEIIISSDKPPRVRIEFEVDRLAGNPKKESKILCEGDKIYGKYSNLEEYRDLGKIETIDYHKSCVIFENGFTLEASNIYGDVNIQQKRRIQIRETIKAHILKEKDNFSKGIKTISLFFIDSVDKYRLYDENNNPLVGEYAKLFEEEYNLQLEKLKDNFSEEYINYLSKIETTKTHNGYFSIDKKGKLVDPQVSGRGKEKESSDVDAFDLIIKNKKKLLDLKTEIRFIFSHSALREGWDNPNVFQICILRDHDSNQIKKRQEVGRGLRLCVNQLGERVDQYYKDLVFSKINILTIIANESFEDFAMDLQKEYNEDMRERPTVFTIDFIKQKKINGENITETLATKIYQDFKKKDYVDKNNFLTTKYKELKKNNEVILNPELEPFKVSIIEITDELLKGIEINKANKPTFPNNKLNKNFQDKDFQELLELVIHKTTYTVDFDTNELIKKSIEEINNKLVIDKIFVNVGKIEMLDEIKNKSFFKEDSAKYGNSEVIEAEISDSIEFDLLGKIMDFTRLSRKTIISILMGIDKKQFEEYYKNPEDFIKKISYYINDIKSSLISEKIEYHKLKAKISKLFEEELEIKTNKFIETKNSHIYDYMDYDSDIEEKFGKQLIANDIVKVFAKIPRNSFNINTPVGNFSPDWLIVFDKKEQNLKEFYFVAETKGSIKSKDLRSTELIKIKCATKHFKIISDDKIKFYAISSFDELKERVYS